MAEERIPFDPMTVAELLGHIARMPAARRQVWDLRCQGLSRKQVAAALGGSTANIDEHLVWIAGGLGLTEVKRLPWLLLARLLDDRHTVEQPELTEIRARVATLPRRAREVWELALLGYTGEEIAARMGYSIGVIRDRIQLQIAAVFGHDTHEGLPWLLLGQVTRTERGNLPMNTED
jgi:DNA-binding CsgD family transcriptional regulator